MGNFNYVVFLKGRGATPEEVKKAMAKVTKELDPDSQHGNVSVALMEGSREVTLEKAPPVRYFVIHLWADVDGPKWGGNLANVSLYMPWFGRKLEDELKPNIIGRILGMFKR